MSGKEQNPPRQRRYVLLWQLAIAAVVGGIGGHWLATLNDDAIKSRAIIRDVAHLRRECRGEGPRVRRGKVLVWDMISNEKSRIHDRLPDNLKMHHRDRQVTVVMVLGRRYERVGRYHQPGDDSVAKETAERMLIDLCLVNWPEKTIPGPAEVVSDPKAFKYVDDPQREDDQTVADWITKLRVRSEAIVR
jgi:hypothetical protein